MFNLLPPVPSDFLATLYKRFLISPGFVNQILPGTQPEKLKVLICNRELISYEPRPILLLI
jgi:hypothetical protein